MDEAFFKRFGGSSAPTAATQPEAAAAPTAAAPSDFMSRFGKNLQAGAAPSIYDSSEAGALPENALDVSPVDTMDRAKLGIGNQAGALQYLKTKFDDAQVTKEGALVVKKDNRWHQVDPSGFGGGSLLDKAKEGMKDVADLGDVAANAIGAGVGAAAGAFAGGAGAVPGAGIGGGLAAASRIKAAKYLGTYSAAPEDEMKDIALDAVLSAGGEGIAKYAAKPIVSKVGAALSWIGENASPAAKDAMATMLSAVNPEIRKDSAKALMTDGRAVMSKLDAAIQTVKGADASVPLNVQETLKQKANNVVGALFDKPRRALSAVFDREENELLSKVPAGFKAEVAPAVHKAMGGLAENGFVAPVANEAGEVVGYKLGNANEIKEQLKHAFSNGADGKKVLRDLKRFVEVANDQLQSKGLRGADAAEAIINTRRQFDKFYYTTVRSNPALRDALMPISGALRNDLVSTLGGAGTEVANKYAAMNAKYASMLPHVAEADRILRLENGKNAFVNKLMGQDASNAKTLVGVMEKLKGRAGTNLATDLNQTVAAQDFVKAFPHLSFNKAAVASAVGYGAAHSPLGPLAAIAAVPATLAQSPRLVGRAVAGTQGAAQAASSAMAASLPYARQFGTLMQSLSTEHMRELMMHPDAFPKLIQGVAMAAPQEQQMSQQLLQNSGVIPPAGGQ
jgi:hypothetical protein